MKHMNCGVLRSLLPDTSFIIDEEEAILEIYLLLYFEEVLQ